MGKVRLVCISDTHNRQTDLQLPAGDVLVHAGDFTGHGRVDEVAAFADWLRAQPHAHKVVIAGNHDWLFERQPARARAMLHGCTYLQDEAAVVAGLRFWGSPWQPWFYDWAFNLERGAALRAKWDLIPEGTEVLVTHGPPMGLGDRTVAGEHVGCQDLLEAIARVRPRVFVCGHIHEGYGTYRAGDTQVVNASTCDVRYRPIQPPVVVDLASA